ncbi:SMI1/KNR4 family protein [Paenibacillus sp. MER TA 81-3]|uniref:SMI1/KNR4 family protein n=1 Tax=Paenibacillus sp. MER TA 81-3 TaxID=2939573 RepID=UPI00203FB602|nr:SMI1/KNR4 family protein [Paenibacillus sp. MER TA 81-3]MCM3340552.1 SMI1/KNR4 family protein [Paenibacillus sp. MER TA 81-3]
MLNTEQFLSELSKRVPLEFMADGAYEEDFKPIETVAGYILPESFKMLYALHNGEKSGEHLLMLGFYWMSLQDILYEMKGQLEIAEEYEFDTISYQKEYIQEVTWSPGWIPFAADGSGNYIALDLTPGVHGKVGQIISCGRDENEMCELHYTLLGESTEAEMEAYTEYVMGER